jgi:hypothetical protein
MEMKNIIAVTVIAVLVYVFVVKKGLGSSDATGKVNAEADSFDVNSAVDDGMSEEEKAVALAEAEEKARLRNEYSSLYGKSAPSYYTLSQLASDINTRKQFNDTVKIYIQESGDRDISDNAFTTVADVERALSAAMTANASKKTAWINRQAVLRSYVEAFITTFKDDGTLLSMKAWNTTALNNLLDCNTAELVFCEDYFSSKGVKHSTFYGESGGVSIPSIYFACGTKKTTQRKSAPVAERLRQKLAGVQGIGINKINEYGELSV